MAQTWEEWENKQITISQEDFDWLVSAAEAYARGYRRSRDANANEAMINKVNRFKALIDPAPKE